MSIRSQQQFVTFLRGLPKPIYPDALLAELHKVDAWLGQQVIASGGDADSVCIVRAVLSILAKERR